MSLDKTIKRTCIRPLYNLLYKFSPQLAAGIKCTIYYYCDTFRGEKVTIRRSSPRKSPAVFVNMPSQAIDRLPGVNRVNLQVFKHLSQCNTGIIPVQYRHGTLVTNHNYVALLEGKPVSKYEEYIDLQAGDRIFYLHSDWNRDQGEFLQLVRQRKVQVYVLVHDLLPIQHPELCPPSFSISYEEWLKVILQESDSIICVSRTTADVLARYYREQKIQRPRPLELNYFHLGADFPVQAKAGTVREEIKQFVQKPAQKTILMVGKLTPRKGHAMALDAFTHLFQERYQVQLLILGRPAENGINMAQKLQENKILTGKVLWLQDATDAEVAWAYQHTAALLEASFDEGFGLPLVEAAHYGLPIICSDIPIFHEVVGAAAAYFKVWDAAALQQKVIAWLKQDQHPDTTKVRIYTWEESAGEINDILTGKAKPYQLLQ